MKYRERVQLGLKVLSSSLCFPSPPPPCGAGSELPVQILSVVSTVGRFAVRVVHPPGEQEACLRDISDMIRYGWVWYTSC